MKAASSSRSVAALRPQNPELSSECQTQGLPLRVGDQARTGHPRVKWTESGPRGHNFLDNGNLSESFFHTTTKEVLGFTIAAKRSGTLIANSSPKKSWLP